jgi:hypothetical protein
LAAVADALGQLDLMAEQLQKLLGERRAEQRVINLPPLPRRVN